MKIVIKGAGDLATGIASRLYHAGHQIVMTEIAVLLTVRRSVALSRAVYENEAEVEDLKGVLVKDAAEADRILQRGEIPVLVDPEADIIGSFHPDVVVDAILAKHPKEAVAIYLNAFAEMNDVKWPALDVMLESDQRLQVG